MRGEPARLRTPWARYQVLSMVAALAFAGCSNRVEAPSRSAEAEPDRSSSVDATAPDAAPAVDAQAETPRELSIAGGRLIARVPAGFDSRRRFPPLASPEVVGVTECVMATVGEHASLGVCALPTHVVSTDHARMASQDASTWEGGQPPSDARIEDLSREGSPLSITRVTPTKTVPIRGADAVGATDSVFYVGHPDGTVIVLRIERSGSLVGLREKALAFADSLAGSLRVGPIELMSSAGARDLPIDGYGSSVRLEVPEGWTVTADEGGGLEYVVARPRAVVDVAEDVALWLHGSPPWGLEGEYREHRGRDDVMLFGRPVTFFTKRGGLVVEARYFESVFDTAIWVSVDARPGASFDAHARVLATARLRLADRAVRPASPRDAGTDDGQCRDVVIVDGTRLNVRARPDTEAEVVERLDLGTVVSVAERSAQWVRLVAPAAGWVWRSAVRRECLVPWTPRRDRGSDASNP